MDFFDALMVDEDDDLDEEATRRELLAEGESAKSSKGFAIRKKPSTIVAGSNSRKALASAKSTDASNGKSHMGRDRRLSAIPSADIGSSDDSESDQETAYGGFEDDGGYEDDFFPPSGSNLWASPTANDRVTSEEACRTERAALNERVALIEPWEMKIVKCPTCNFPDLIEGEHPYCCSITKTEPRKVIKKRFLPALPSDDIFQKYKNLGKESLALNFALSLAAIGYTDGREDPPPGYNPSRVGFSIAGAVYARLRPVDHPDTENVGRYIFCNEHWDSITSHEVNPVWAGRLKNWLLHTPLYQEFALFARALGPTTVEVVRQGRRLRDTEGEGSDLVGAWYDGVPPAFAVRLGKAKKGAASQPRTKITKRARQENDAQPSGSSGLAATDLVRGIDNYDAKDCVFLDSGNELRLKLSYSSTVLCDLEERKIPIWSVRNKLDPSSALRGITFRQFWRKAIFESVADRFNKMYTAAELFYCDLGYCFWFCCERLK